MTILPIPATNFSALPSCDPRRLCSSVLFRNLRFSKSHPSSLDSSAHFKNITSFGGRKTALGFSNGMSPSAPTVRCVPSSRERGDETSDSVRVNSLVAIMVGSDSDLLAMKDVIKIFEYFGVPYEVTIVSAPRTSGRIYSFVSSAIERGIKSIIVGAGVGCEAFLPVMVAALTTLPVFGVLIRTSSLDSSYIKQRTNDFKVGTAITEDARNLAMFLVKYLALMDADLSVRVNKYQNQLMEAAKPEAEGWVKIPAAIMYNIFGEDEMSNGIPVETFQVETFQIGTFQIGDAENAALLAARMLSFADADLSDRVSNYNNEMKDAILAKGWEAYLSG